MIELQLLIEYNGSRIRVFDHLVFTEKSSWKIDDFRAATGEKLVEGQRVTLEAEDCVDRKGRCHLIIDSYDGRTRNKVAAYLPPALTPVPAAARGGSTGAPGAAVKLNEFGEPDDIDF
jgi:hypothetical protein